jgi:hypothetical protein
LFRKGRAGSSPAQGNENADQFSSDFEVAISQVAAWAKSENHPAHEDSARHCDVGFLELCMGYEPLFLQPPDDNRFGDSDSLPEALNCGGGKISRYAKLLPRKLRDQRVRSEAVCFHFVMILISREIVQERFVS